MVVPVLLEYSSFPEEICWNSPSFPGWNQTHKESEIWHLAKDLETAFRLWLIKYKCFNLQFSFMSTSWVIKIWWENTQAHFKIKHYAFELIIRQFKEHLHLGFTVKSRLKKWIGAGSSDADQIYPKSIGKMKWYFSNFKCSA